MEIAYLNRTIRLSFPYRRETVETVKEIAGTFGATRAFDPETKIWKLPRGAAAAVDLAFSGPEVSKDEAFQALAADIHAQNAERAKRRRELVELIPDLTATFVDDSRLLKHQQEAIRWMIERGSLILADDMGLGKTRMALVAADHYRAVFGCKVIVVAPVKLHRNWRKESKRLAIEIDALWSWASLKPPPNGVDYVLIADEAHYATNWKAHRTRAFLELARDAIECWPMTGTPMPNGQPRELFPILRAVRHPIAIAKQAYESKYCDARETRFTKWDTTGASNLVELHERIADVFIRRTKDQCLDLPPKTRILRECEETSEMQADYAAWFHKAKDRYEERVRKGEADPRSEAFVALNMMRHAASVAKVVETVDVANEVIQQGRQIVLLTAFRESANRLASILTPGVPAYTGAINDEAVFEMIEERFVSGKSRAFIGTIKVAGVGLNLQVADTVVLVDRPWKPGDAFQAEDRIQRIGQTKSTFAIWMQCFDVDRWVDDILLAKEENIGKVIDGETRTIEAVKVDPRALLRRLSEQFNPR